MFVCSSENADGGKGQAHKEVMFTVAEMKKRLPSDKRRRSKASTVEALHYALNCVKQVQGITQEITTAPRLIGGS